MSAFDLLSAPIREYIWDKQWPNLRPIQNVAITQFLSTENNLLITAPTASGKTEAAFLPSMSAVEDWDRGVKIIYISPLIALINDQFRRIQELSEYLDVPITSWHGEASQTAKKRLVKQPRGILLITPESVEAMLVRRSGEAKMLFGSVETVIIDEIHSFLGTARGLHLQTLLHRSAKLATTPPRYIGLSATISSASYDYAKSFFGHGRQTSILLDEGSNQRDITVTHIPSEEGIVLIPPKVIDDIFERSIRDRMLVFPNARTRVEEITVGLQRRATKLHAGNVRYFAHHASVDKDLRLEAEQFAKASTYDLFTICCTSTLELGIDIGSVDAVVQVEAPHSVASLAQRLGRSGRRTGISKLVQYTTHSWSLLQALAALSLMKEGSLDPVEPLGKQYSMLFQQTLSLLLEASGMERGRLVSDLRQLPLTRDISEQQINYLLNDMIKADYLEESNGVLIVGLKSERIITSRGFYTHFQDKTDFTVIFDGRKVGELPLTPEILPDMNIFLAGKIWKIIEIDMSTRKIFVRRARDGKPPKFGGGAGNISSLLRQRMHDLLTGKVGVPEEALDNESVSTALNDIRQQTIINAGMTVDQRCIVADKYFYTFAGSRVNYTLTLMLAMRYDCKPQLDDSGESVIKDQQMAMKIKELSDNPVTVSELHNYLMNNPNQRPPMSAKYMIYLPDELLVEELMAQYYDLSATNDYLKNVTLV